MIELERHIEILLLSNDCVIVPNFGGFMAHHVEARYDDKDGVFLPPQRTLGFNPQLILNDSLLAQSYIEAYDISYPEAIRRINDEVRELRQHIENTGQYEFNDLGVITRTDDGRYEFTPCDAGILTPELYGLGSFEMAYLAALTPAADPTSVNIARQEETECPKLTSDIFVPINDRHNEKTISLSTVRNIAVACIAVLAFLLFPSPAGNGNTNLSQSSIDTGMLYRILPKGIVQGGTELEKHLLAKDTLRKATTPQTVSTDNLAKKKKEAFYSVVLCSRVTERNARSYTDRLHREGYPEAEVYSNGKNTKVIYGRYSTETEAHQTKTRLNSTNIFKDCWVTKVKGI